MPSDGCSNSLAVKAAAGAQFLGPNRGPRLSKNPRAPLTEVPTTTSAHPGSPCGSASAKDSVEWEGRSLLKALIKKSALCGEQVHILGCEVSEEEFREGFDSNINSRLVYHDLFRDPLNWSKTGEALPGGPLEALRALCRRTDPGPVTIALDSLSWLLLHLPCTTLCQTLHTLSRQDSCHGDSSPGEQVHVLGLLHEELHGPGPLGALSSLAQTEVTLSGALGQASAHILYRRPQQRPSHQTAGSTVPWAGPAYQPHFL
ncbi:elongator complex protein 5 isoform X3 [Physeter macrocephalus]|uniref:Elongator complex protein 5 n=1 Tax=Physeter macrocephalus TaxID=9755 RepID=A0A9W2WI85_PHYMC|nr:elongator complex protein 5 isoform X3 [Physeter catodon]